MADAALEAVVFRSRSAALPVPASIGSVDVGEWPDHRPCGCAFPPSPHGQPSFGRGRSAVEGAAPIAAEGVGCEVPPSPTRRGLVPSSAAARRRLHAHGVPAGLARRARGATRMRDTPPATSDLATLTA
jgi:hypothetical protein